MFIRERRSDEDTPGVHEFVPRYTNSTSGRVMPLHPHRRSPDRPARGGRQVNTNIGEREKMRENRMNETRRRRRYSHHFRREGKAVSPVVATLILILIAVAAAAALYLWLVAWQGGVTKGIGSPGAQYTVTIGGSTSVYPFDTYAVAQFEQNNTDVVVSNNQGGTGAGMVAVCAGSVDIGAASTPETQSGLEASDGCSTTQTELPDIQIVAYDAVDIILPAANTMGIVSMNSTVLLGIYLAVSSTSTGTQLAMPAYDAATTGDGGLGLTVDSAPTWSEIPTTAGCATQTSPGHFSTTCTLSSDTAPIVTVSRSDASGTTQAFEARLLGATSATLGAQPYTTLNGGSGFSGCGSNNLLADCGITTTDAVDGNPAVIAAVAANPAAIGYASDGLARASGSGVLCQGVPTAACGVAFEAAGQTTAIQPSLGATGSIATAIKSGLTATAGYAGWRPFEYVTLGTPTGEIERFIQFVLDPANNQNFATEAAEVSIYSV